MPGRFVELAERIADSVAECVKVRELLQWFQPAGDSNKARRALRAAMEALDLESRPNASTSSISSEAIIFRKGRPPVWLRGKSLLTGPDISEITKKLSKSVAPSKLPEVQWKPRPSDPSVPSGACMQMLAGPIAPTSRPRARVLVLHRGPGCVVVSQRMEIRDLAAILLAESGSVAHVVDDERKELGRITLDSVLLSLACEEGRATLASILPDRIKRKT